MKVDIGISEYTEEDKKFDRAWQEGYYAFVDRVGYLKNPYVKGEFNEANEFILWNKGWREAKKTHNS